MNIEIPKFLNDYIAKLTSEFDIEEIWLFGSRANNMANEDSDWDIIASSDCEVLNQLKSRQDYISEIIDLMILYDGNNWEQPWIKTGQSQPKKGNLKAMEYKEVDSAIAEYIQYIDVSEEDNDVKHFEFQEVRMYKIWEKNK